MGMRRRVGICVTDAVGSPAAAGVIRPMILVPAKIFGWSFDAFADSADFSCMNWPIFAAAGTSWMDWVWSVLLALIHPLV